jgi:hypothetical protein
MAYGRIWDAYERTLTERVRGRQLMGPTKTIKLNQASRVFEACLCALSPRALEAMASSVFGTSFSDSDGRGYLQVVMELKQLLDIRDPHLAREEPFPL